MARQFLVKFSSIECHRNRFVDSRSAARVWTDRQTEKCMNVSILIGAVQGRKRTCNVIHREDMDDDSL